MTNFLAEKAELSVIFNLALEHNNFQEFLQKARPLTASLPDSEVKSLYELTIRNAMVEFIMVRNDIQMLERIFEFSIQVAGIGSPNLPVLVFGDMIESSTIVECEKLFSFLETRVETFKKEFFFKTCKNYLLRTCNDLLKRLSRSQNTVFCGRILLFLAHLFPLSERSGLNIVSEFNLENATAYNTDEDIFLDITSEKGDVTEEGEILNNQSPVVVDKNLYQKFWSLQDFFRCPNTCYNKMQWRQFVSCTSEVLNVFGSFKSDDANSSKWKLTKLPTGSGSSVYFAKYLTSPKLLELELSDSHFRRYVLVQFLILFQYLISPVKFKLEVYSLTEEQQTWLKETTKKVNNLLEETPPNGANFAKDVEKILQREEYWNAWKNEGCPDFKQSTEKIDVAKRSLKRPWEDFHTYKCKTSTEMSKLWTTPNNWEACKSAKRNFVPTLESFFGISGDKSEVKGSSKKVNTSDSKYIWKSLRLLCMKSPHFFTTNPTLSTVSEFLQSVIQKLEKEKPPVQDNDVETTVIEDSIEDGNDEFSPANEEETPKEEEKPRKDILTKLIVENISENLIDHWQPLAAQLGFPEDEIEYLDSFPKGKQQVEQMLNVWIDRDGYIPDFISALEKSDMPINILSSVLAILQQN